MYRKESLWEALKSQSGTCWKHFLAWFILKGQKFCLSYPCFSQWLPLRQLEERGYSLEQGLASRNLVNSYQVIVTIPYIIVKWGGRFRLDGKKDGKEGICDKEIIKNHCIHFSHFPSNIVKVGVCSGHLQCAVPAKEMQLLKENTMSA